MEERVSIQTQAELEDYYKKDDPWGYENNESDSNRKAILLSELEKLEIPKKVLDIGCGHGFITRDIPGEHIIGVDLSVEAIKQAKKMSAKKNIIYKAADVFDLTRESLGVPEGFDQILITGVLYGQYIGSAKNTVITIIDNLLVNGGILVSVHINDWYKSRFPYVLTRTMRYTYRDYTHLMEIYKKI